MNMLTRLDIYAILLIAILVVQVLIYLKLPRNESGYKNRQRKQRIERMKETTMDTVEKVKNGLHNWRSRNSGTH